MKTPRTYNSVLGNWPQRRKSCERHKGRGCKNALAAFNPKWHLISSLSAATTATCLHITNGLRSWWRSIPSKVLSGGRVGCTPRANRGPSDSNRWQQGSSARWYHNPGRWPSGCWRLPATVALQARYPTASWPTNVSGMQRVDLWKPEFWSAPTLISIETEMSSFWRNFRHWLQRKLSFWQLALCMTKIS